MITLKGETIVPEFLKLLDDYVEKTYGKPVAAVTV
jgi:hypothetical protein